MIRTLFFSAVLCLLAPLTLKAAQPAAQTPTRQDWSFSGADGQYDKAQLRRGLQIYQEKCRACHGMEYLDFRSLTRPGGPELSIEAAKEIASGYVFVDTGEDGEPTERNGRLSDHFVSPFTNAQQAKYLNGGIEPVDLTYITRARSYDRGFPQFIFDLFLPYTEQGSDFVYAVLTGYEENDPPMMKNRYFPGGKIRMARPLNDNEFSYPTAANGKPQVPQTEAQYAKDVTAFLNWAADPDREQRQSIGQYVFVYLAGFLVLCVITRRIAKRCHEPHDA